MEHNGATTWWWSVGELYSKVQLFWEDYTNFRNLSHGFDICLVDIIVEGVQGLVKVGSDHSIDSCPISTQGNSANTDWIHEALKRSNPWTNLVAVKTMRRIMQIFVAFSECMNFKEQMRSKKLRTCYISRCRHHELFFRLPHTESLRKPKPKTEPPVLCPTGGFESWLGAALVAPPRHILL